MRRTWLRKKFSKAKEIVTDRIRVFWAPIRRKSLRVTDFSIISNNCWGGKVYLRYGLPYMSPTVGLYFFAEDYIRFIKNLKYYMSLPITVIPPEESAYYEILKKRGQLNCPIGKLDDVEIVFLHYHSSQEAVEKWERRKKRINWEKLIVKFSEMNCCEPQHLNEFAQIDFETKFAFVATDNLSKDDTFICLDKYRMVREVKDDTTHFASYININKLLNENKVLQEKTPFLK